MPETQQPLAGRSVTVLVVRWAARIIGSGMFLLLTAMAIGEGVPNPWAQPWRANLGLHIMFVIWVGFIVAWKWEGVGGTMLLGGVISFWAVMWHLPRDIGWLCLLPGMMYLFCRIVDRRSGKSPVHVNPKPS